MKHPAYRGPSAEALRESEAAVYASMPVTQRCMFCPWSWSGSAGEGRTIAQTHLLEAHPDVRPKRRRHNRVTWDPSFTLHEEDAEQIRREVKRRAYLNGVDLQG